MNFFSGFCFCGEKELFAPLTPIDNQYTLSGFSYGAILAFLATLDALHSSQRIQTLNLFSPAFFQDRKPSFLKAQILTFRKNPQNYIQNFLPLCGNVSQKYFKQGTLEELETLLYFEWKKEELEFVQNQGVAIHIFIGEQDQIISPQNVMHFFAPFGLVHLYKNFNHCLQYDHL